MEESLAYYSTVVLLGPRRARAVSRNHDSCLIKCTTMVPPRSFGSLRNLTCREGRLSYVLAASAASSASLFQRGMLCALGCLAACNLENSDISLPSTRASTCCRAVMCSKGGAYGEPKRETVEYVAAQCFPPLHCNSKGVICSVSSDRTSSIVFGKRNP